MRIALVARFLGLPIGLGTYAVNLLQALDRRDDDHEYFVYTPTWNEVTAARAALSAAHLSRPARSRAAHTLWDQTCRPSPPHARR